MVDECNGFKTVAQLSEFRKYEYPAPARNTSVVLNRWP